MKKYKIKQILILLVPVIFTVVAWFLTIGGSHMKGFGVDVNSFTNGIVYLMYIIISIPLFIVSSVIIFLLFRQKKGISSTYLFSFLIFSIISPFLPFLLETVGGKIGGLRYKRFDEVKVTLISQEVMPFFK